MEIFIDESGSFVTTGAKENSWCTVAAFTGVHKSKYRKILANLKCTNSVSQRSEIKLRDISEDRYEAFLNDLHRADGVLMCTATDSSFNQDTLVKTHQKNLIASLLNNIGNMKYDTGKQGISFLAKQIEEVPNQLYIQLLCQIYLMNTFMSRGISYFVQRNPRSLKKFVWRVDQKSPNIKTHYEDAFEKICPALLQTMSLRDPGIMLKWCDYSYMADYMYKEGDLPEYLVEKNPQLDGEKGLNIQKVIRDDIDFIDSVSCKGLQIADLLASGLRKVLRKEFMNNERIAHCLGRLMIQEAENKPPLKLITFGQEINIKDEAFKKVINTMTKSCRPMLVKN